MTAADAALLGSAFPNTRQLLSGDINGGISLAAGSQAVQVIQRLGAACQGLQVLEMGADRLAYIAGVAACTALCRLRFVHRGHDVDSYDRGYDGDWGSTSTPTVLGPLATLSGLETLEFQADDYDDPTPAMLQELTGLQRLKSLTVVFGYLTGGCLAVLEGLPALTHLEAWGLLELEEVRWQLPRMARLNLWELEGGLPVLGGVVASRCAGLRTLEISNCVFWVEGDHGGLRQCVRMLCALAARGLLAGVQLRRRCSPAQLRAAWQAELGGAAPTPGAEAHRSLEAKLRVALGQGNTASGRGTCRWG